MNITLIGMPGSGKSTVGLALARHRSMRFVDVDVVMMEKTGKPLARIIEEEGDDGFRRVEERINAELDVRNSVISPGGSVVYGPQAMARLRQISRVVYLKVGLPELTRRLGDLHTRGVTLRPGQTLEELYLEREPLYLQYAHHVVDCGDMRLSEIVEEVSGLCRKRR